MRQAKDSGSFEEQSSSRNAQGSMKVRITAPTREHRMCIFTNWNISWNFRSCHCYQGTPYVSLQIGIFIEISDHHATASELRKGRPPPDRNEIYHVKMPEGTTRRTKVIMARHDALRRQGLIVYTRSLYVFCCRSGCSRYYGCSPVWKICQSDR